MKSAVILFIVVVMLAAGVVGIAATQPSTVPPAYIAAISNKIDTLTGKVDVIGADVLTIKSDVATLKSDVADLKAELASVARMESYHGFVWADNNEAIWTSTDWFSGPWATANFHVTIRAAGLTAGEKIAVHMNWGRGDFSGNISSYEFITADGVYTYDFDANFAQILTLGMVDGVSIAYAVTVTYVNQP